MKTHEIKIQTIGANEVAVSVDGVVIPMDAISRIEFVAEPMKFPIVRLELTSTRILLEALDADLSATEKQVDK